ncbi:DUF2017 domain-containing protein [Mycobacterium sp.]|uniref:oxidative stress transcriptional regulator AosR n=1 Tax=Mycobacterium sp. TaxID=1785 RepID=UPI002C2C6D0D|nr:DUF2017 domain-containing protein [Mycobacterium sp.]HME47353.1 DUF2017 domain-containing protein [Mycobacterium sp.]
MRKWKRVETADGLRFRSALASHEASLLHNLVASLLAMLEDRESSAPSDELQAITGIRTGNSRRPEDATMARLLPDFYRSERSHPAGSANAESLNAALRSLHEPAIIDAKREAAQRLLRTIPQGGGRFELTKDDANAWIAAVNDVRLALGTMLGIGPDGPDRLPDDHPLAGHLDVYQWLTVMQEYLVVALTGKR